MKNRSRGWIDKTAEIGISFTKIAIDSNDSCRSVKSNVGLNIPILKLFKIKFKCELRVKYLLLIN